MGSVAGRELANANIMPMMLSVFDIPKAVDSNGNEIEPKWLFGPGIVSHPKPFDFTLEPRSADAAAV